MPDLSGRTVVVTGATGELGRVVTRTLTRAGARVVAGVRDPNKGHAALTDMPGPVEVRRLDVASLASVRDFAQAWTGELDVVVHSAGVMDVAARTDGGLDLQTATNFLGPFLLTSLLLPHVTDRVVHVTSQLHKQAHLDVADLDWRTREYRPMDAYRDSKLAQVLFSLELQHRLTARSSPVRSILAHPGIARTPLAAHSRANVVNRIRPITNSPEVGALSILYAATVDLPGNAYVGPRGPGGLKGHPAVGKPGRNGMDADLARDLWDAAADLTGAEA